MAEEFDENTTFMQTHQQTWNGFTKLLFWSALGVIVVLIFLGLITL